MPKTRVLFVCVHNSARSQMAAALLNRDFGDASEAESAGIESGSLNPLAVAAMRDIGIDISHNTTHDVFDFYRGEAAEDYRSPGQDRCTGSLVGGGTP